MDKSRHINGTATLLGKKKPTGFRREATGLLREINPFHSLVTTISAVSIGFSIAGALVFIPFVWPGANISLAFIILLPFLIVHSLLFSFMAWSMPRAGGDYVWTGRILNPAVGTAVNLVFVIFE